VRFLSRRKALASFKSDRAHLRVWVHRFRRLSRFAITRDAIRAALADWHAAGYSPRELRHRWRILSQLFSTLDPDLPNPCKGIKLPRIVKSRPRSVADTTVQDVAARLRDAELRGRLRDAKTRARYLVLATTGQRPAQLKRALPADVDLERRIWFVDPAKGDNGTVVALNAEMLAAWQLYIAADAWGAYDSRSFAKTLRRNGWPAGIRPYNLRHTVGLALSEADTDLGDIQAHMGHTSPATTRIYVPGLLSRLKLVSAKLEGRLSRLPQTTSTNVTGQSATIDVFRPVSEDDKKRHRAGSRRVKSLKSA
jgi:integrase